VYHDIKSWGWWGSNWIVLAGSAAYTKVQQEAMKTKSRAKANPEQEQKLLEDENV